VSISKVDKPRSLEANQRILRKDRLKIQGIWDLRQHAREAKHRTTAIYRIKEKRLAVLTVVGPLLFSALPALFTALDAQ
jgi:hypothetical protein